MPKRERSDDSRVVRDLIGAAQEMAEYLLGSIPSGQTPPDGTLGYATVKPRTFWNLYLRMSAAYHAAELSGSPLLTLERSAVLASLLIGSDFKSTDELARWNEFVADANAGRFTQHTSLAVHPSVSQVQRVCDELAARLDKSRGTGAGPDQPTDVNPRIIEALLLVLSNPGWSDRKIAKMVRVNHSTLCRSALYQRSAAQARGLPADIPKGHITDGGVEAEGGTHHFTHHHFAK